MKKIFSAFLLMTMMVASVGSFVSCSDIENAIANVEDAANNNAASIKDLESKIAALQTALQTAQSEAAAAKAEANAAKQAAATAKAEAIAAALAEIEKVNGDVDAVNAEIKKINDALAGCATKEAVELLQATIDEYKALTDENAEAIAALEEALAALGENVTPEQLAEVVAKMTAIDQALVAFQNRLQSVSYVPEWVAGPTAVLFAENEEYGFVHMSYEVAPAAYASKITAENTKLVGVALKETKSVEVEEHDVKILSADPETGIVEVIAYIGVDSEVWTKNNAAVALRVVAEDAQFTSAYTNVTVLGTGSKKMSINDVVFFGTYNEDGDFTTDDITHKVAYDTAVAESEVALFEGLVARVNVEGFFEYLPVEEAAEMFGIEIEVTEKVSSYATKYFVTTNAKVYDLVEDEEDEADATAFVVANDETLDITVKFNEAVVNYLKDNEDDKDLTDLVDKSAKAELKKGYFQVNGKTSKTFDGLTANYVVTGLEKTIELVLNNDEAINVEWTPENYTKKAALTFKDLDVTGGDARHLLGQTCEMKPVDEDGKVIATTNLSTPRVQVKFISVDNADVTVIMPIWPAENTTFNYTFEGTYEDAETEATVTTVKVTFDLAVAIEAAPEAIGDVPAVDSLAVTLVKSGEKVDDPSKVKTVIPFNGVVEKLLPYYKSYYETEKEAKAEIAKAIATKTVGIYVVDAATGVMPETAQYTATYTHVAATTTAAEASTITIPYNTTTYAGMSEQYVRFAFDVDIFGVKSTVIADCAKVSKWVPYTAPTIALAMGKFDATTLKGANPFVWKTFADQWTETVNGETVYHDFNYVEVTSTGADYTFYNATTGLKLSDYVKIVNAPEGTDLSQYTLRIKMTNAPYYTVGTGTAAVKHYYYNEYVDPTTNEDVIPTLTSSYWTVDMYVPATAAAAKIDAVAATATTPALNAVPAVNVGDNTATWVVPASDLPNLVLKWNGSKVNNINIKVDLVAYPFTTTVADIARIKEVSSYNVNFTTPKAVTLETVETEAYEFVHGENLVIDLAKHIKVTDLFGNQVNNTYGTWADRWADYAWVDATTPTAEDFGKYVVGTDTDFFQAYGQEVEIVNFVDATGADLGYNIKNDNDFSTTAGDYTFANGVLTINGNLANISRETTFTVRVKFTHMNDGFVPEYKEITVKVVNAQ